MHHGDSCMPGGAGVAGELAYQVSVGPHGFAPPPPWLVFVPIHSTLNPLSPRPFLTTSPSLLLPAYPCALTGELLAE